MPILHYTYWPKLSKSLTIPATSLLFSIRFSKGNTLPLLTVINTKEENHGYIHTTII